MMFPEWFRVFLVCYLGVLGLLVAAIAYGFAMMVRQERQ